MITNYDESANEIMDVEKQLVQVSVKDYNLLKEAYDNARSIKVHIEKEDEDIIDINVHFKLSEEAMIDLASELDNAGARISDLRSSLEKSERDTKYYKKRLEDLEEEKARAVEFLERHIDRIKNKYKTVVVSTSIVLVVTLLNIIAIMNK